MNWQCVVAIIFMIFIHPLIIGGFLGLSDPPEKQHDLESNDGTGRDTSLKAPTNPARSNVTEMSTLTTNVTAVETDISALITNMSAIQTDTTTLKTDMSTVITGIEELATILATHYREPNAAAADAATAVTGNQGARGRSNGTQLGQTSDTVPMMPTIVRGGGPTKLLVFDPSSQGNGLASESNQYFELLQLRWLWLWLIMEQFHRARGQRLSGIYSSPDGKLICEYTDLPESERPASETSTGHQ